MARSVFYIDNINLFLPTFHFGLKTKSEQSKNKNEGNNNNDMTRLQPQQRQSTCNTLQSPAAPLSTAKRVFKQLNQLNNTTATKWLLHCVSLTATILRCFCCWTATTETEISNKLLKYYNNNNNNNNNQKKKKKDNDDAIFEILSEDAFTRLQ